MKPINSVEKFIAVAGIDHNRVFADYLAIVAGVKTQQAPCAIAQEVASHNEKPGVVFEAFAKFYGMTSLDIAQTSEALVLIVIKKFPEPSHRKLTHYVEATDYRESTILTAFEDVKPGSEYIEHQSIPLSIVSDLEGQKATIKRQPTRVVIPYETIRNQTDWINTIPPAILSSIYREESEAFFAMLEANPPLMDQNPVFFGTNTAAAPLSFSAILALFRDQKTAITEHVVGAEPKYIIVPSWAEVATRNDIRACDMGGVIEVVSRPDIVNMYLLADPEINPTLVRFAISRVPSVFVEPVPHISRALAVRGENDFDFVPVSRYGICRLTPI
ncbi:MAG: hypothetical protein Q7U66_06175 [Methylobacter sp.]|nr:hypothetical protein [Methylobacter sp.]